ncbi:MAG: hypothetical protein IPL61_29540 [Myxococcales bacterium]|nr:hypothetical protein [Myxococcales bacterium]
MNRHTALTLVMSLVAAASGCGFVAAPRAQADEPVARDIDCDGEGQLCGPEWPRLPAPTPAARRG